MATILAKKTTDAHMALDDDHYDLLAADTSISQFPQGTSYDTTPDISNGSSESSVLSAGGFNPPSSFSTPVSTPAPTPASSYGSTTNTMGFTSTSQSTQSQPVLTSAGTNAAQAADVLVANNNEDWINKKWRPVMGWVYMLTCTMDFVVFPILWSLLQALSKGSVTTQWQPLTLQGAGLYHIAMGAVLGIAAYGRTKEKVAGAA